MSKSSINSDQLLEQQDAVSWYLNALLSDTPPEKSGNEFKNVVKTEVQDSTVASETEKIAPIDNELADSLAGGDKYTSPALPDYLQDGFQSLSFGVADIKLCVPLQQLNGIIDWDGRVTRLPGQAKWCLGLIHSRNRKINIIDLYGVLNNRPRHAQLEWKSEEKPEQFLLLVGHNQWGLACDSVDNIGRLDNNDVNWRISAASSLIMGTDINGMRLIINADEIVRRLQDSAL